MDKLRGNGGGSAVIKPKPQKEEAKQLTEGEIIRFVVRPRNEVSWAVGTIDNENMGKKKSKLCCIFNGGHELEESSSSDEDCCHGHHDPSGHDKDANRYDRYPKH